MRLYKAAFEEALSKLSKHEKEVIEALVMNGETVPSLSKRTGRTRYSIDILYRGATNKIHNFLQREYPELIPKPEN